MAVNKVLMLPELLENILGHLDMKTLLLAQRINEQFRSVIENSKDLQEKLYLRLKLSANVADGATLNPLLTKPDRIWSEVYTKEIWQFAIGPFTLPPNASARRMYISSHAVVLENMQLSGGNSMTHTAGGLVPLEGDDAPEHWKESGVFANSICSTCLTCDEFTKYEGETLQDFLRKTINSRAERRVAYPSIAPFAGFDWENSSWMAPWTAETDDKLVDSDIDDDADHGLVLDSQE